MVRLTSVLACVAASSVYGQAVSPTGGVEPALDLGCTTGPHAPAWQETKATFRALLEGDGSSLLLAPREAMANATSKAVQVLTAAGALGSADADCGLGRLCLQLLSVANVDDPSALVELFSTMEKLSSPVLTTLLEFNWAVIGQSGWPIFGLLGQINLRKGQVEGALNNNELDGLNDEAGKDLLANLITAFSSGDPKVMEPVGSVYLMQETNGSALAPLTAIAARAFGSQDAKGRLDILSAMQNGLRQVVATPLDLDIATSTNWPMWGLLHLAADGYY